MCERAAWILLTRTHKCLRTAYVHASMIYEDAHAPTIVLHETRWNERPEQYLTSVAEILFSLKGLMETFTPMKLRFVSI